MSRNAKRYLNRDVSMLSDEELVDMFCKECADPKKARAEITTRLREIGREDLLEAIDAHVPPSSSPCPPDAPEDTPEENQGPSL
jgi:hypothetical protein